MQNSAVACTLSSFELALSRYIILFWLKILGAVQNEMNKKNDKRDRNIHVPLDALLENNII